MTPALDAIVFFTELSGVMHNGMPDRDALNASGVTWQVKFLRPPMGRNEMPTD